MSDYLTLAQTIGSFTCAMPTSLTANLDRLQAPSPAESGKGSGWPSRVSPAHSKVPGRASEPRRHRTEIVTVRLDRPATVRINSTAAPGVTPEGIVAFT
jgi:hypothetical protein